MSEIPFKTVEKPIQYQRLDNLDLIRIIQVIPDYVKQLLIDNQFILAGGAIRSIIQNEPVNDFDLFATTTDSESVALQAESLAKSLNVQTITTENAITVKSNPAVQLITKWPCSSAYALLNAFDFSSSIAAIWYSGCEWTSLIHSNFYGDIAAKRLRYNALNKNPIGVLLRVIKFSREGWRITPTVFAEIVKSAIDSVHVEQVTELSTEVAKLIVDKSSKGADNPDEIEAKY